jgi:hypothetical protein
MDQWDSMNLEQRRSSDSQRQILWQVGMSVSALGTNQCHTMHIICVSLTLWRWEYTLEAGHSYNPSFLGALVAKHMPLLLHITECKIGNGYATFFWHDRWLLPEPLATLYPALFSHHTQQHASVHEVLLNGIEWGLRNRLSNVAAEQLALLLPLLQVIVLSDQCDQRSLLHGEKNFYQGSIQANSARTTRPSCWTYMDVESAQ